MGVRLYLAPIRGITDFVFRNTFSKYFKGFDIAIAPFVTTQSRIRSSQIKGLFPENNTGMPVIPQILSKNPDDFVLLAKQLYDMGYETINWNLGCPFPMVANKQRGSGMLPFPDRIDEFLEKSLSGMPNALSVKTRLGYHDADEIFRVMPVFNRYPLTEIIIHPRTGRQMYGGIPDRESFEKCIPLSVHPLVYNGDIVSLETFRELSERFGTISRWMIGRGALADPFLPESIKNNKERFSGKSEILKQFHGELFRGYEEILDGPAHVLGRMKGFWQYFALSFGYSGNILKKIHKSRTVEQYEEAVCRCLNPD